MFEERVFDVTGGHQAAASRALRAETIDSWKRALAEVERELPDAERIDLIRSLEELKAGAEAAQARLTADFDSSQRAEQAAKGLPARRQGEGIAGQIAFARRESPVRGGIHLGLAKVLVHEMPGTLAAMTRGRLSEYRATLLARETAGVSREDRATIDATMTADLDALEGTGDRSLVDQARRLAYELDPESVVRRNRKAESERTVTIRPAPDTMSYVTALVPVVQGVAMYAALKREADSARASGDPRANGQVMADTMVQRVTGQAAAERVPLSVGLVMTDRSLLGGHHTPAELEAAGPVPAAWARELVAQTLDRDAGVWLRRLFANPTTGRLVTMDSRQRRVPGALSTLIRTRDRHCRTPWCDAPIRHDDHVVEFAAAGPTSEANLQGLCQRCNHAKQAPGWQARPRAGPRHTVEVTTPTGHRSRSMAPPAPGTDPSASMRARPRLDVFALDIELVMAA